MAYVKTNWVDDVTPLSATNMNNIEDKLLQVSKVNAYQSLETTKLRMELLLTQLNSVGFYDLFDTLDDINLGSTKATVDIVAQDVTFSAEPYNLTVASDVTSSTTVTTKETATIGDKIDDTNVITDVVDNSTFYSISNGSYDSVSFSVSSQDTSPREIKFSNDGTKLFIVGSTSDTIYQYSLPTPFILTGMSYDSVSFSVSSQETNPYSITFNNDGTKLFMIGVTNRTIYQYSLPTPYILTGMSYDSVSFSVSSQETGSTSITFNNDGTKLFIVGQVNDTIYQYSLPTPFILTGMSYDSVSFSVSSQETSPNSITFNNDGTKLFIVGIINRTIYQYSTAEVLFDLALTSPITALADDVLSVYLSEPPYDRLNMNSQQFAVTGDNVLVKLYTKDINNPLDLKYQVFINGVECSLIETLEYELTFELANINSDTIVLKVNGKDGVVLDDLLVAIS